MTDSTLDHHDDRLRIAPAIVRALRCPTCASAISRLDGELVCCSGSCRIRYPVVAGVPIMIDDRRSVLRVADIAARLAGRTRADRPGLLNRALARFVRPPGDTAKTRSNFALVVSLLRTAKTPVRVLVLGDDIPHDAMLDLRSLPDVEIVQANLVPGSETTLVFDPHDMPFMDSTFDAVVARNVFQRVADPWRSLAEVHRLLKPRGLVYAETAFMQQVDGEVQDFYRFTHLGLRRLFRSFDEVDSGAAAGPGVALAWAWRYFLWSFAHSRLMSFLLRAIANGTSFCFAGFDRHLLRSPRALDSASRVYFLGRRSETHLSDRELIAGYRGAGRDGAWDAAGPRPASEVFSRWAAAGWDDAMARNHAQAVQALLAAAFAARGAAGPFRVIDAGCGSGWVVRALQARDDCLSATGVDGSASMIAKARSIDPAGDYILADLVEWTPPRPVHLVHSMEVLYYLEDPGALMARIRAHWLLPGGWAVFGIDHYAENTSSLVWPARLGIRMTTWSQARWRQALVDAGFTEVHLWHVPAEADSPGTLAMLARAPGGSPT